MMNGDYQGLAGLMKLKGRMGDTQLVHMSPMEVKALDAMAPGGLTRNPSTGLPEAFKLKDILPTLGAIAGGMFLAPMLPAFLGTGALATGVATGLGGAAGSALAGGNRKEILGTGLTSGIMAGAAAGAKEGVGLMKGASSGGPGLGEVPLARPDYVKPATLAETSGNSFTSGLKGIADTAGQSIRNQGGLSPTFAGAFGAASTSPAMYDVPAGPEVQMFPKVTSIQNVPTGVTKEDIDKYIRQGGATPNYFDYKIGYAAEGGDIGSVEMFSGRVPSSGEGDGMSDNVEFEVVGDPEINKAMLSPDEYVLSAHDVALIGNGSTDAGVNKLDEFRKALREKGYGRKSLPNQINPRKELSKLS
jgi:hypothetical protein